MPEPEPLIVPFRIKFQRGDAEDNRLDFYDGASSLFGFAKSLQISTHYLVNGRVTFHAPAVKGVRPYMLPSRRGSFEQIVQMILDHPTASIVFAKEGYNATKLGAKVIYDFTKHIFSKTIGKSAPPETEIVSTIEDEHGPDLDALSEALDGPLKEAHRTIAQTESVTSLGTGRTQLITFTPATYDYLRTRIVSKVAEKIEGGIAAYNVNSGRGRIWDPQLERTIPFEPDREHPPSSTVPLSWSLDQRNRGLVGTIEVTVRRILTIDQETKKYILLGCRRLS